MKHNIVMTCEAKTPEALLLKRQIRKCILAALEEEGVDTPCEINVPSWFLLQELDECWGLSSPSSYVLP